MEAHAFFLPAPDGQRFCVYHPPQGALRARVLYIHPLAEEMNKSRRMAALQARALAAAGCAVLQMDLRGCGDSSGDFGDACWDDWVADVVRASAWLQSLPTATSRRTPLWLWGLRAGCLLAQQAAAQLDGACHFLYWQPPASGQVVLQPFLRLQWAARMASGTAAESVGTLRQRLQMGESLAVAGYRLTASVAQGLEQAVLRAPAAGVWEQRVEWFELSAAERPQLSTLSEDQRAAWSQPGIRLVRHALAGPAFWQTPNGEDAPALREATTAALCAGSMT